MKSLFPLLLLPALALPLPAQSVPPPDRLLPAGTIAVLTVPDMSAARRAGGRAPYLRIWSDPAMEPFVSHFRSRIDAELIQPLESGLGFSLSNLWELAQGQLTFALTRAGSNAGAIDAPGRLLIVDSRDRALDLKKALAEMPGKWSSAGHSHREEVIQGTKFLVLALAAPGEVAAAEDAAPTEPATLEHFVGQSGSVLLIGTRRRDIENTLTLLANGPVAALGDTESFAGDFQGSMRDATAYGWLNVDSVFAAATGSLPESIAGTPIPLNPQRIVAALGLDGLKSVSVSARLASDGEHMELRLRVPEAERRGIFRLLEFEAQDAAPPAFVPAEALVFSRTRIDLPAAWRSLEQMLVDISPQLGGLVRLSLETLGKDKDSNFEFRREFVGNLGSDLISWSLPAPADHPAGMPYETMLIQSPQPDRLMSALNVLLGMIPPDLARIEDREVNGHPLRSVTLQLGLPAATPESVTAQSMAFAATEEYLAVGSTAALVEAFLNASADAPSGLRRKQGLEVAAQKVGGFDRGMFSYTNDREALRSSYEALRAGTLTGGGLQMFRQFVSALGTSRNLGDTASWFDPSLLPPFSEVERYFDFSASAGQMDPEGFHFKYFAPHPPGLE